VVSGNLATGDIIAVPAGADCVLQAGQSSAISAVQFQLCETARERSSDFPLEATVSALEELLELNERRLEEFSRRPCFELIRGAQDTPELLQNLADYRSIWAAEYRRVLWARQSSCTHTAYQKVFFDDLAAAESKGLLSFTRVSASDPTLEALAQWVAYQMHVVDDAEKLAITCLVLDASEEAWRAHGLPTPEAPRAPGGAQGARTIRRARARILDTEGPETLLRLQQTIDEAWDTMGAIADRLAELTDAGSAR
jgi:hypothetical protein